MRITVYSPAFYPLIGGLEEVARLSCIEFAKSGHEVVVLTKTALGDNPELPFKVHRHPTFATAFAAARSCHAFVEFNISLKGLVFPFLAGKPAVISHQSWFSDIRRSPTFRARLKRLASRFATNIACSHAVKDHIGGSATVIPNAYDEHTFCVFPNISRDSDLIFVGRLVSDKGCSLIIDALKLLKQKGKTPSLTIVGSGPEQVPIANQADAMGVADQVRFTGPLKGHELALELNRHRIMVAPSLWAEPFGIVALEGIACGCHVVGSEGGGLVDAIGPCGRTFSNGDSHALTRVLTDVLNAPAPNQNVAQSHLARHTSQAVGAAYIAELQKQLHHQSKFRNTELI